MDVFSMEARCVKMRIKTTTKNIHDDSTDAELDTDSDSGNLAIYISYKID